MRAQAKALAQEAGRAAIEARREAKVYSDAAHALAQQAFKAEAVAAQLEKDGDLEGANEQLEVLGRLRALIERNYEKADEKGQTAVTHERQAFKQNDLAARLKHQSEQEG